MKIINASFEIMTPVNGMEILKTIEAAARTCYKSEDRITEDSAKKFVRNLLKRGHEAMIEHAGMTVKFICDRGVSHELVRHRLASYAQESTRYVNYSKGKYGNEITVIKPCFWDDDSKEFIIWKEAAQNAETAYMSLIDSGASPEQARSILPNSQKTEIIMTANFREWRHFLKLRTANEAHPQMRELARPLLRELQEKIPELFSDIDF